MCYSPQTVMCGQGGYTLGIFPTTVMVKLSFIISAPNVNGNLFWIVSPPCTIFFVILNYYSSHNVIFDYSSTHSHGYVALDYSPIHYHVYMVFEYTPPPTSGF